MMTEDGGRGDARVERGRAADRRGALRIGLTGPIGCGKSTVGSWLSDRGGVHLDADRIAREVTDEDPDVVAGIRTWFGSGVVDREGRVDRAALATAVFPDPQRLRDLEAIVHPAVHRRLLAALRRADDDGALFVVLEAIKLVEAGLAALCDEVWIVSCTPGTQRSRLASRGVARDDADRRIAAQGADLAGRLAAQLAERRSQALVRIIPTEGVIDDVHAAVDAALDEALAARDR